MSDTVFPSKVSRCGKGVSDTVFPVTPVSGGVVRLWGGWLVLLGGKSGAGVKNLRVPLEAGSWTPRIDLNLTHP